MSNEPITPESLIAEMMQGFQLTHVGAPLEGLVRTYGEQCAAEARKKALEEAIELIAAKKRTRLYHTADRGFDELTDKLGEQLGQAPPTLARSVQEGRPDGED